MTDAREVCRRHGIVLRDTDDPIAALDQHITTLEERWANVKALVERGARPSQPPSMMLPTGDSPGRYS